MYANDQELSAFKVLINNNLEEAKRIFTRKLDVFRNEMRTASDLIPADVNQVKGERFSAIKATANGDCLFNSSSILHGNESIALYMLSRTGIKIQISVKSQYDLVLHKFSTAVFNLVRYFPRSAHASNGMKRKQIWPCESTKSKL